MHMQNRAPASFAGEITRPDETVVESAFLNPEKAPEHFGVPVKMVNGKLEKLEVGDTAPYGVLARVAPSIADGDKPNPQQAQSVVVRGYIAVDCSNAGQPPRGGQVYFRKNSAGSESAQQPGAWAAKANGQNFVPFTGAIWSLQNKDSANGRIAEMRVG